MLTGRRGRETPGSWSTRTASKSHSTRRIYAKEFRFQLSKYTPDGGNGRRNEDLRTPGKGRRALGTTAKAEPMSRNLACQDLR